MPGDGPNLEVIMDSVRARADLMKPPDYWLTCKHVGYPNFPGRDRNLVVGEEETPHLRLWVVEIPTSSAREQNSSELTLAARAVAGYVLRGTDDLQRFMARATADLIRLFMGNVEQDHPDYTGPNTWGLMTVQTPGTSIDWEYPEIAGSYGVGIVWGSWDISFRHPFPKG